ncbi:DUF2993 domain-containing protein [Leifsonia sp. McL0607]|uniref:LmeA family phospholipid-binding protein n=1 Tax=Leifsonia sp. McL0607 TaxID=3415672 RepID=UPI003CF49A4B
MSDQPTEVLPDESSPAGAATRGRPRWLMPLLLTVGSIVVVLVLLVVADVITRAVTEQRVAAEIEKNLPSSVQADVQAHIGGFSVLAQFLEGSFESVELDAPHATVNGAPLSASIHATGVPVDFTKPIQSATGTLSISQESLNKLVTIPGAKGDITLDDGVIGYDGTIDLLGLPVDYTVTATPEAAGDTVLLTPGKATVSAGSGNVNVTRLIQALTANGPFPVCAAQYLPDGVKVSDITVTPGHATVTLSASDFVMDEEFLHSKGSCS